MNQNAMYAPSLAAMHLASQLGGGQALWVARLANWRRTSRVGPPPIPWHTTEAGNPTYDPVDLDAFIAKGLEGRMHVEEARRQSPIKAGALAHLDSATEAPHVRVSFAVTGTMQAVYALDSTGARRLAAMLNKAADQVEKIMPTSAAGAA